MKDIKSAEELEGAEQVSRHQNLRGGLTKSSKKVNDNIKPKMRSQKLFSSWGFS
jgi:hypothetical protein